MTQISPCPTSVSCSLSIPVCVKQQDWKETQIWHVPTSVSCLLSIPVVFVQSNMIARCYKSDISTCSSCSLSFPLHSVKKGRGRKKASTSHFLHVFHLHCPFIFTQGVKDHRETTFITLVFFTYISCPYIFWQWMAMKGYIFNNNNNNNLGPPPPPPLFGKELAFSKCVFSKEGKKSN